MYSTWRILIGATFLENNSICPYYNSSSQDLTNTSNKTEPENVGLLLDGLNGKFLSKHKIASHYKHSKIDTVVVYLGNELSLWKKNNLNNYIKTDVIVTPSQNGRYTRLKQICHIPLTVQSIIKEYKNNGLTPEELQIQIGELKNSVEIIYSSLDKEKIFEEGEESNRQRKILGDLLSLLTDLLSLPVPKDASQLYMLCLSSIKEDMQVNIEQAASAQVLEIDNKVSEWGLKNHSVLKNSRVLIVGPHGPRLGRVDMQYFISLYHKICEIDKSEVKNNKLYYVEMLPWQMEGINIKKDLIENFLMGSELNKSIGKKVLNNRYGMFRDILEKEGALAVEKHLSKL